MDLLQLLGENEGTYTISTLDECGKLACCCKRLCLIYNSEGKKALIMDWLDVIQRTLLTTEDPEVFLEELSRAQASVRCWGRVSFRHLRGTVVPTCLRKPHFGQNSRKSCSFSLCSATAHEFTNPVYWLMARARYANDGPANNYLAHEAYLRKWNEHHNSFLHTHSWFCLEAAHTAAHYRRYEKGVPEGQAICGRTQALSSRELLAIRAATRSIRIIAESVMRDVVAFGLRAVAYEDANLATFFGLLDWLFQTPKLAWQDWLVSEAVSFGSCNHRLTQRNRWNDQAKRLSVAQLLCLFKFFDSEGKLVVGDYPINAIECLIPDLPPLSPLSSALLGRQGELVSQQDWMRLSDYRNQIIHHSQAQREVESFSGPHRQPAR